MIAFDSYVFPHAQEKEAAKKAKKSVADAAKKAGKVDNAKTPKFLAN